VASCALIPGGNFYVEAPRLARAPACEIVVFDLESGGAAHVRSGDRDWLLDCGSSFRYKSTVLPYLRSRGVNQLDALLVTHGDTQHMGGALGALDDFQPRQIIDSTLLDRSPTRRALHLELARRNVGKTFARRGDSFVISPEATLQVLYPPAGQQRSAADDKALVLRLESSGIRVLFMSDSGFSTEQWLLNNESDMRADLLVKGQHAKDLSGTPDFIAHVQPQVIISAGVTFGADSLDQWAQDVGARGITLFRQDRAGAVQITIRDGAFAVEGFLDHQTFRSRAR
jgi:competence protein ComEC